MDLTVALRLQARADGVSAVREMRQETSELAAAIKEVREAARSGGQVSGSTIKALGGFDEFHKAFAAAQRDIAAGARPEGGGPPIDQEKLFRGQLRMTNEQAKVRLRENQRVGAAELKAEMAERAEAQETLRFKLRMRAQERREAEETAAAEVRAAEQAAREETRAAQEAARAQAQADRETERSAQEALRFRMRMTRQMFQEMGEQEAREGRQRREAMRGMGLGMFAGPGEEGEHGGGHHGRGLASEFKTAAGYTLVYGGINKLLEGVGAVASAPFSVGRMTLGVAQQAREVVELGKATRLTTNQVQEMQYAFAAKGLDPDKLPQTMLWLARSEVGAARGIKNNALAFKALGVNVFDAHHRLQPLLPLFYEITDALHHQSSAAKADAISQMIFGRGVKDILPIIQGGSQALKDMAGQADKSGFVITPDDLERGEQLAGQWARLKLQFQGVRNSVAVAAMPIVSDVLGDASSYLTTHRAEIAKDIKDNFIELKADLPVIVSGMKSMADDVLAMSKNVGPFVNDLVRLGESPVGRFLFSGQLVPGGRDLSKPEGPGATRQLYDPETHQPLLSQPAGRLDVHIHPPAGMGASTGAPPPGTTVNVHRGMQVMH